MSGMVGGTTSTQICCLLIQLSVNKVLLLSVYWGVNKVAKGWLD